MYKIYMYEQYELYDNNKCTASCIVTRSNGTVRLIICLNKGTAYK